MIGILSAVASAVDYLHAAGLVHRDIKPLNVMMEPSGRVVLMDFGIARHVAAARRTATGMTFGTPAYMSPEQVRGEPVGPAADIYALGLLTYELLGGRPPFDGASAYVMHAHAYDPPPPLDHARPGLPEGVYAAIEAALAKEQRQRPASAGRFVDLLTSPSAHRVRTPPTLDAEIAPTRVAGASTAPYVRTGHRRAVLWGHLGRPRRLH